MHLHLFLIRHGETIDNVKGIIAGIKDSPLTIHGSLQASRLGKHMNLIDTPINYIFSSTLQRAKYTAKCIGDNQLPRKDVISLPELMEQNFGHYEGLHFKEYSERKNHDEIKRNSIENAEQMCERAKGFIKDYFEPLTICMKDDESLSIVIVSHGNTLRYLWKEFLSWSKVENKSIDCSDSLLKESGSIDLLRIGGWSNTGILECIFSRKNLESNWALKVITINDTNHLKTLKRTKGGIGSSRYDEGQIKIDEFFKRL